MKETRLEQILENISVETSGFDLLGTVEKYLCSGGENLTKDQYIRIRHKVDDVYRPFCGFFDKQLYNHTKDSYNKKRKVVNELFADYLTDQHYKLLDEYKIRVNDPTIPTAVIPNTVQKRMYYLERIIWSKNKNKYADMEAALIEEIPYTGLSMFKVKTLGRMQDKTSFFSNLRNKIMGYIKVVA